MGRIDISDGKILIDDKQVQLISGSMHYFRIHPGLWDDRLDKAVAFGLNTVETYIPWNLHEPHPEEYVFSGICDLELFIDKVRRHGLKLILRPGPYICAEWDNGGFPAWLSAVPNLKLRRMNQPYLEALTRYFDRLLPLLRRHLYTNGGPVIMLQIENEYGSYCHDKEYLHYIRDLYLRHGIDVPLFTADGADHLCINGGTIPEEMMALNFGSGSQDAWRIGREVRPEGPDCCMEFWNGWFDHWGEKHHTRCAGADEGGAAHELELMLGDHAHVNFYMFHGGTNFGFTNGANGNFAGEYEPTVTSYDYDCPLSECGDPNEKFYACQKVIARYTDQPGVRPVEPGKKICPGAVHLTQSVKLADRLEVLSGVAGHAATPPTMEQLQENFGFIHYRKHLTGPLPAGFPLRLIEVNDYAQVWLDGKYLGSRMRDTGVNPLELPEIGRDGAWLDILVENCGRINYGPRVGKDFKGIVGGVTVGFQFQLDWDYCTLPMADISGLRFGDFNNAPATFHRGEFELAETGDAFLRFPGVKGVAWVNGFNLGRYWNKGPTETLYIPSPVLRTGRNELVIFELEKLTAAAAEFSPEPILGEVQ